jgi:hypothetical protein
MQSFFPLEFWTEATKIMSVLTKPKERQQE